MIRIKIKHRQIQYCSKHTKKGLSMLDCEKKASSMGESWKKMNYGGRDDTKPL